MKILVLGSAAGGGFPQWNCSCPNCAGVRDHSIDAEPQTQSSIAISEDGKRWILINASPDIRQQINQNIELWPTAFRRSPICGVVLTDAQIDHVTGLLTLREGLPLNLYCTKQVYEELTQSLPIVSVLNHWSGGFHYSELPTNQNEAFSMPEMPNLEWRTVPIKSNAPPYSLRRNNPLAGDNVAFYIKDKRSGKGLFYAPGIAKVTPIIKAFLEKSHCIMLDGTCWSNEEMDCVGSKKRALEMGHLPISGPYGTLELLAEMKSKRRILIHINNTNPILRQGSQQRECLNDNEIEVAYDGMLVDL